jgi:uridine kinase
MISRLLIIFLFFVTSELNAQHNLIVGIAGGSGSGKTTFARKIKEIFGDNVVLLEQDSYYKDLSHITLEERKNLNFDHPDILDFDLLRQHLLDLKLGQQIVKPVYDFKTSCRTEIQEEVLPAKIIIVEGVLLFAIEEVRNLFDIKIYIDVEDDIRFIRRLERDINERGRTIGSVINQYLATVKPMHSKFVSPSKKFADIVILGEGDTKVAEQIIASRLSF